MIQCEYSLLPKLQYLYFKRGFLNSQFLTHSVLLTRVGNYTNMPLYLPVRYNRSWWSSLCPTLIKKVSFFPAEKPFLVACLKTKISTLPPHYQPWPRVTQASQSEYLVFLGTEIGWSLAHHISQITQSSSYDFFFFPKPVVVGRIMTPQIYPYPNLQNL